MTRLRIGLLDSGLGLVGFADAVATRAPHADLLLAMDPQNMPYGALTAGRLTEVVLRSARALAAWDPDAIVVACNTASVHTLGTLRAELEPRIPIIGTVPAIKPAAATGRPFAVWATDATTASDYQRKLIDAFAADVPVARIAASGLAEAIEAGSPARIEAAIAEAADATPPDVASVVLGCTHYGLVADRIVRALEARGIREVALFDSPAAVAAQTLRRVTADQRSEDAVAAPGTGTGDPGGGEGAQTARRGRILAVYQSGESGRLPAVLNEYPVGRRLLDLEQTTDAGTDQTPDGVAHPVHPGGRAPVESEME
ncbi:glutamate racemase [Brevibacterium senegalense]|uniref:glutamate racemase n=1 Tax=Brevibacterium senegalense TaxID=1033736 RepID=UPI0002E4EE54|nr:aspartate/glutamate racemase family protein [Brevibacterium senegalense]